MGCLELLLTRVWTPWVWSPFVAALPSHSTPLGSHSRAGVTLMDSFHCIAGFKQRWSLLMLVFDFASCRAPPASVFNYSSGSGRWGQKWCWAAPASGCYVTPESRSRLYHCEVYYLRGKEEVNLETEEGLTFGAKCHSFFIANTHFSVVAWFFIFGFVFFGFLSFTIICSKSNKNIASI